MTYEAIAGSDEPADVRVEISGPTIEGEFAVFDVEARNEGDRVAEEAIIEVCAGPEACGEVSFTYIPQGSKRSGVVGLPAPLEAPVTTRVVSYRKP